jgi:hypothetical protein
LLHLAVAECKATSNPSAQHFAEEQSLLRRGGAGDYRPTDDGQHQEVSVVDGDVACSANSARRSEERFQGRNGRMSWGALPPAAAQLAKYHVSHNRGLIFQCASVANSENIIAASFPQIEGHKGGIKGTFYFIDTCGPFIVNLQQESSLSYRKVECPLCYLR